LYNQASFSFWHWKVSKPKNYNKKLQDNSNILQASERDAVKKKNLGVGKPFHADERLQDYLLCPGYSYGIAERSLTKS